MASKKNNTELIANNAQLTNEVMIQHLNSYAKKRTRI